MYFFILLTFVANLPFYRLHKGAEQNMPEKYGAECWPILRRKGAEKFVSSSLSLSRYKPI
jgi:hypothetical protein